jgi:hypothetical protein
MLESSYFAGAPSVNQRHAALPQVDVQPLKEGFGTFHARERQEKARAPGARTMQKVLRMGGVAAR